MAEAVAVCYALEARLSRFQVRAFAAGMLSAFGHNPVIAIRNFSGEARFQAGSLEDCSLQFRIDAAALSVTNDISDKDRLEIERVMRDEVLETARYPQIEFDGSGVSVSQTGKDQYRAQILGNLQLHGVTRRLEIPVYLNVNEDTLRANGEFTLRQSDYGMRLISVVGGTLKLKDELKFTFDIVAHRKTR